MDAVTRWLSISGFLLYGAFAKPLNCAGLFNNSQLLIKGLKPYVTEVHPANATFVPIGNPAYPQPVPDLPEFCRFGAEYNTSAISKFRFEVWLPKSDHWNGRFAFVGNGGDAGGVNYADMAIPLAKYGFAVASTDTGHNGTSADGTFAISNPESQIDFGHRAVHLSTVFAKAITKSYYGKKSKYNYWVGCSSGGKQGMKSAQMYPNDFDGVIAGAPAQWWPHLNGFTTHVNRLNANSTTPGAVIPPPFFVALNQEVVSQCDKLDGVSDGIITNPRACKLDLTRVTCGSANISPYVNSSNCLSDSQLVTLEAIYSNWTSTDGEFLFPTFEPGSEFGWPNTVNGVPYGPAPDYFSYQVLNKTSVQTLQINETELQRLTKIADETDPGQTNAIDPNLNPFFKRGGKLMQYHGFADPLIPPGSSLWYYEHVRNYFKNADLSDRYRLFMLPGVGHCSGGPGADAFGRPGQRSVSQGGAGQSLSFTPQYDMILATINWVEKGVTPKSLIGVKYNSSNSTQGAAFTRLFCPYPQEAIYRGGDRSKETSKARSQREPRKVTRPLSQQFFRPSLIGELRNAKSEPRTPKRLKLSQEQPWAQNDLLSVIKDITLGENLDSSAFTPIELYETKIKHAENTPNLDDMVIDGGPRFEEPGDIVIPPHEQLDNQFRGSSAQCVYNGWDLPKNIHKVAHSPPHQRAFDHMGVPWAVQWEVARLVTTHPELSWDDVPLGSLEQLCGPASESAPQVAYILFGQHPSYKLISARERTTLPPGGVSPWVEYDQEDMLLRTHSTERLGCEGSYFGGKIDQILRLSVNTSGGFEFRLQPPAVSTSCRFRRYLGSRRFVEVRFSEKEPRLNRHNLRAYMINNALVINGRIFRAFYAKTTTVHLVETNEALDREEDDLIGDQYRQSLRDFIEWHNPLYANPSQALTKWSSRFMLGFSTSQPGVTIAPEDIYLIEDIIGTGRSSNSAIMTDGAGFINATAMNQIASRMKWSSVPVCIQARFGGSKGLFILHPSERAPDDPPRIYIRPSQIKVKLDPNPQEWCSSHRIIDVLARNSMSTGVQVTDQVIMNLSHNGVSTPTLDSLTRTYLESASLIPYVKEGRLVPLWDAIFTRSKVLESVLKGLTPDSIARAQGLGSIKENDQDLLDVKFSYQPDPHSGCPPSYDTQALGLLQSGFDMKFAPLFNKVESIQKTILFGLDEKCHLHIPHSACAFVIPDPLMVLEAGEIFCGFNRPTRDNSGTDISTVTGPVLVTRNPCIIPSDVRKVIAVECPELWTAGYTDVIVFSVKGEHSLASMLGGGDYDGDTVTVIWEEAIVDQFTNSPTYYAEVDVSDHFASNPKCMKDVPPDDFRSVLDALLAPLMPSSVGMYGNWHAKAAKVLGLDHPETVRLGNVFTTCLDGVKTGLTILPKYQSKDSSKWNNVDNRIPSKLSVIEDLKYALDQYRRECESEMSSLKPYTRLDEELLQPYKRERDLCGRVPGLKEELAQIVEFVDRMRFEYRDGEFSISQRHGKARFESKTKGRKKHSRRQHQESEWAASEAYNKGLPKGLLNIRDEMVPRIAASYAYSQDNPWWPAFSFVVGWSELCKIKAESKGPVMPMNPQFGSLMAIPRRARQQLDLIA